MPRKRILLLKKKKKKKNKKENEKIIKQEREESRCAILARRYDLSKCLKPNRQCYIRVRCVLCESLEID